MTITPPSAWKISRQELTEWLDALAAVQTLIAPRQVNDVLLYRPVNNSQEVCLQFDRPALSAKEFFFPSTERLFKIEKKNKEIGLVETLPDVQQVLFGIRPCDARGLLMLDALFLQHSPTDPYYARRRENTTVIVLACKTMGPLCFCTSVGGAPDDPNGADVMLYETDEGYHVEALSEKGQAMIPPHWQATQSPHPSLQVETPAYPVPAHHVWPMHFQADYWQSVSERCLSCRACAYVCPTCRCFIVRDEMVSPEEFERLRCWDSCSGENYRRVAGGHRPRANPGERLRNRIFCKLYYYPEQYNLGDLPACTGCGRCIEVCPVNIDITEILTDVGRLA